MSETIIEQLPPLFTPKTYGELREYMTRVGNHKNRYAFAESNAKEYGTFLDDEKFLLMLMSTRVDFNTHLPLSAIDGIRAINQFLEPSATGLQYIRARIGSVATGAWRGLQNLIPRFNQQASASEEF